jgi:hypothetical protein
VSLNEQEAHESIFPFTKLKHINKNKLRAARVAQVVERLPGKCKALSTNSIALKKLDF